MALLTEEDVRRMSNQGTRGPVVVNRDQMLTPGARDCAPAGGGGILGGPRGLGGPPPGGGRPGKGPRPPPPNTALCSVPH